MNHSLIVPDNSSLIPACNHTSVGIITIDELGRVLLLERKKYPFGMACPAGHVEDGESYEHAVVRELQEETGYTATSLNRVIEMVVSNECRRPGGSWHAWHVYQAEIAGELVHNTEEAYQVGWFTWPEMVALKLRTEDYQRGYIPDDAWLSRPGFEPVWYNFFHCLGWW